MTQIKICGITNKEDALCAAKCGAAALGFIFYPASPRYIKPEDAEKIISDLPGEVIKVGVFVNEKAEEIKNIMKYCNIDMIQLHGDESPEYCQEFPASMIIKAVELKSYNDLNHALSYNASAILVDSRHAGLYGGTGRKANWELATALRNKKLLILSGGLNEKNIIEALRTVNPAAVDINSGVEISPGRKDHEKLSRIFNIIGATDTAPGKFTINIFKEDLMNKNLPDKNGHFGIFGGRYAAETLMPALIELEKAYKTARKDKDFRKEFEWYQREYAGRATPLYYARRMSELLNGAKIYLKREDLNHTGSHKINNTLGQALLARSMGKKKVIAETGAGQHGVATATVAALFGMECKIFMGEEDIRRQAPNVFRMKILGAEVVPVKSGTATLKDAMNEAMRYWVSSVRDTFYVIGTTAGPHPYPRMVRDFQSVIGRETRKQIMKMEGRNPDVLIACVGGGSNAMGMFYPFREEKNVEMFGVEAAGHGLNTSEHSASINGGKVGVLHGNKTYLLQDENGQVRDAYSIAAGLDYPGVGPEHAYFHAIKKVKYVTITDKEAVAAFSYLSLKEGIIPALESAHAVAYAMKMAPQMAKNQIVVICLSGRGDKDAQTIIEKGIY